MMMMTSRIMPTGWLGGGLYMRSSTKVSFTSMVMTRSRSCPLPFSIASSLTRRGLATKKAGGSSNNGRDSAGRRLGIKVWPGQIAQAGNILVRQRGQKFRAGEQVGMGTDHTLFAKTTGQVYYTRLPTNRKRNVVHILPLSQAAEMTHPTA